ncbi:MAG: alpha amylase C-terminal domain-containing protein, partial [Lysobacteraceae bacterium]
GKKLLFMGQEFAQPGEWRDAEALPWHLLQYDAHAGVRELVRDLNALYRDTPALHALDGEATGFEWLVGDDREQSAYAWARHDGAGDVALVACNFTPVPRQGYRLPLPAGAATRWREALNTDAAAYGGSGVGNAGTLDASDGRLVLTLPPLATVVLRPA